MPNYISKGGGSDWLELTATEIATLGTNPTPAAIESLKVTVIATGRRHKRD